MKAKRYSLAVLLGATLLLSGCGSSSSSSSTTTTSDSTTTNTPTEIYTGHVIDAPVEGLDYICTDINGNTITSGTTDSTGKFTYTESTFTCQFGLEGNDKFLLLYMTNTANYPELPENIVVFPVSKAFLLQTLDNDGDLNNGIQITADEKNVLTQNYNSNDLYTITDASGVASILQSNDSSYSGTNIDLATGTSNIDNTIVNTIPAGTYTGTFKLTSGDPDYCLPSGDVTLNVSVNDNQLIISGNAGDSDESYAISATFGEQLTGTINDGDNTMLYGFFTSDGSKAGFSGYYSSDECKGTWEVSYSN